MTDEELEFRFRQERNGRGLAIFWVVALLFMVYTIMRFQIFEMNDQMQSMHYRVHKLEKETKE